MLLKRIALVFLLITTSNMTFADDALYEAKAPSGSAFIRVFNRMGSTEIDEIAIGGKVLSEIKPTSVSPYIFLPEGRHTVKVSGGAYPVSLTRDKYYTLVYRGGEYTLIDDQGFNSRRKSLVSFYNLIPSSDVSLVTPDGKIKVFDNIPYSKSASREINPVKVTLMASIGEEKIGQPKSVSLERGKVFSFFACGTPEEPMLVQYENRIDTSI